MKRVVITGLGAITPIGNNLEEYNEGLKKGQSGAGPITRFDASNFKTKFACEVKNFNPEDFIDRKEVRRMDLFTQFAMVCSDEALADSKLLESTLDLDRIGVIWGSGIGGLRSLEAEIETFATGNGIPRFNPFMIPKMISDIAPGYISIKHGFRGINYCTVSACASATHAMMNAFDYIRLGKADAIITGGSEAAITATGMGGFSATKALSERNDDYLTASRPFDLERDGFVLGEGGGCLIFEEYEHAKARGAKIYAEVMGCGATADAHHITAPHPEGLGAKNVMRMALADAGLTPEVIDYINVHGTSTPLGDIAETTAIKYIFGDHAYKLNISSTKSMTGHLLGGAGAIEGIASVLALRDQYVPPTINHFTDDPDIDSKLNLTFNAAQYRKIDFVMSNTFGFGGHNACIILKKYIM
ncbi:MAG: beta-ketoacyl-ACP synthase II [Saprospiraceae bacterium]|jgi:3-oxoacyl-[acyl-carrier-protein] synthase II|nr:beta-ketoacyl-ACP synthase II [Saprospiraceae bacterium]MCA0332831.1 beta-ketoacyl-ACP synthase II [Bacteroidota bacterium]MCB0604312.1 beta-ketoacyl-ACP synthase II [Saprospiraceae bacterium]HMT76321.1 beta-ketoacyl-ACP synthase II [Saprospiraceae bacterium]HQU96922.1 beta-ketoacyl-ACP synthase II [Saprospiraceae bacterium]